MVQSNFFSQQSGKIDDFRQIIEQNVDAEKLTFHTDIQHNIPIYNAAEISQRLLGQERQAILSEWHWLLQHSSGVLVIEGMVDDIDVIDSVSTIFNTIIAEESQQKKGEGDHFAAVGSNSRIWNAHQKLCLAAPELFARYFANTTLSAICEAWLGPAYQMTAQVNVVHPSGKAQSAHRDYHLGFQTTEKMLDFPKHIHQMTPYLTLQGAVAHCDMPVESGPTKFLPFSQTFASGYVDMKRPEFQQIFEERSVQLPLRKGDGLFFNPALFHAAGENNSQNIERIGNLLQISSAFGRAMESLDREAMSLALYPILKDLQSELSPDQISAAIAACAEAYPFPTNLDQDPPISGMAPSSQAELMQNSLLNNQSLNQFEQSLKHQSNRRQP